MALPHPHPANVHDDKDTNSVTDTQLNLRAAEAVDDVQNWQVQLRIARRTREIGRNCRVNSASDEISVSPRTGLLNLSLISNELENGFLCSSNFC
jgi:hypothetical protein